MQKGEGLAHSSLRASRRNALSMMRVSKIKPSKATKDSSPPDCDATSAGLKT
jgi:hypothetical protein